jgi:sigma-B regulation protein RsbU (phosphoserine phosphatase)
MKLKHRLTLGFVTLIISLYLVTGLLQYLILEKATQKHIRLARHCEQQLEDLDIRAPFDALVPYYRDYVCMDNQLTALAVQNILQEKGEEALANLHTNGAFLSVVSRHFFEHEQQAIERMIISDDEVTYIFPEARIIERQRICAEHPALAALVEKAEKEGESSGDFMTVDPETGENRARFVSIVMIPGSRYMVASAVSMPRILNPLLGELHRKQKQEFVVLQQDMDNSFDLILVKMMLSGLLLTGVLSLLAMLLSYRLAGSIARPIESLEQAVTRIGEGDFTIHVEEAGSRETKTLARRFNHLGEQLTDYVARLEREMLTRQAVDSEIQLVARIQADTLPRMTAAFLRPEFALTARLIPARQAAGDFYDFRYLAENRLMLMVADVAGKDLSASFFMMKARTLLSVACDHYPDDPSAALTRTNELLVEGNTECMFLTLFLAYCDLDRGELLYANAGHHETVLLQPGKAPQTFGAFRNPPLGFTAKAVYKAGRCRLEPDDTLLMYTDGVTEAQGANGELFGEERLLELCAQSRSINPDTLCSTIIDAVLTYETETQSDDITLLAFQWTPQA